MKITRRPTTGPPDIGTPAAIGDAAEPEAQAGLRRGDRVELSAEARLRAQLRREIGDVEAVPAARIAALRAEVEAGAYSRDPLAVAERLLSDVAGELLA
jgi:flagellar biosynthesis anti-sigma factor FlgM